MQRIYLSESHSTFFTEQIIRMRTKLYHDQMNMNTFRFVATCTTEEVIATQGRCYEILPMVSKKIFTLNPMKKFSSFLSLLAQLKSFSRSTISASIESLLSALLP